MGIPYCLIPTVLVSLASALGFSVGKDLVLAASASSSAIL
jgi:hypothetical protein